MKKKNEQFSKNEVLKIANKKPSKIKRFFGILFVIIFCPVLLIVLLAKKIITASKKAKWEKEGKRGKLLLLSSDISQIDIMEGYEFEEYLKTLFFYEGYQTETTTKSRDYGADIILHRSQCGRIRRVTSTTIRIAVGQVS